MYKRQVFDVYVDTALLAADDTAILVSGLVADTELLTLTLVNDSGSLELHLSVLEDTGLTSCGETGVDTDVWTEIAFVYDLSAGRTWSAECWVLSYGKSFTTEPQRSQRTATNGQILEGPGLCGMSSAVAVGVRRPRMPHHVEVLCWS